MHLKSPFYDRKELVTITYLGNVHRVMHRLHAVQTLQIHSHRHYYKDTQGHIHKN